MNTMRDKILAEIDKNYEVFIKMQFADTEKGKFALLRHGKLVEVLADKMDAHKMGRKLFKDGIYSIQEIDPEYRDLGFMSYALR